MSMVKTAKVFRNGGSQAVRLPAEFRFDTDEIFVHRDEESGDLILSATPPEPTLKDYYELVGYLEEELEFMEDRPLNSKWPSRNPFLDDENVDATESKT